MDPSMEAFNQGSSIIAIVTEQGVSSARTCTQSSGSLISWRCIACLLVWIPYCVFGTRRSAEPILYTVFSPSLYHAIVTSCGRLCQRAHNMFFNCSEICWVNKWHGRVLVLLRIHGFTSSSCSPLPSSKKRHLLSVESTSVMLLITLSRDM